MHRLYRTLGILSVATLALAAPRNNLLGAQATAEADTSMPATGIDFSGIDQFWKIVDILSRDTEPTEAQWRAMLDTPGYRLAQVNLGPGLRDDIDLTFKPSRHAEFESLTKGDDGHSLQLKHLALAGTRRSELVAYRDSLARTAPIADAIAIAARFLPPGATRNGAPPLVAFAFFRDDGYSLPQGIVVDLLYARVLSVGGIPITKNLAHEFHHSYINRAARPLPPGSAAAPDAGLRKALYDLRNEGIADQIDKPYPFSSPNPGSAGHVTRYNAEYARTPGLLRQLDSLLTVAADDSTQMAAVSRRALGLFWSNGHPNGAYVAREILETFGVDSLFPAARSPAAFLRIYSSAELKHGRPNPFSPKARHVLDGLDSRYWRQIAESQDPTDTLLPRRSYFGARLPAVPDSLLARGTPQGAPFAGFTPNSPAERAGLRVGGRRGQHR